MATAKRGPRGGGMVSGGLVCPAEDGDVGSSAAELRARLSARDQEIEEMRRRLRELEKLEFQFEIPPAASHEEEPAAAVTTAEKAEVDARSIYVGNVDYGCSPEEIQQHFQFCGTVNRVTILTDNFGQPKGFAYVEFVEVEAVQNALLLNETELHGRLVKVCPKRTNIPGMNQSRGRHRVHPFYPFYPTYGKVSRFRRHPVYSPYY
ncbi:hypothetical protein ACP70R_020850 [Stipagrostis hirtigluma subsp. patula]